MDFRGHVAQDVSRFHLAFAVKKRSSNHSLPQLIVHAICSVSWVDLCYKERLHGNASLLVKEDGDYWVWGSIDEVRPQGRGGLKTTALIGR